MVNQTQTWVILVRNCRILEVRGGNRTSLEVDQGDLIYIISTAVFSASEVVKGYVKSDRQIK